MDKKKLCCWGGSRSRSPTPSRFPGGDGGVGVVLQNATGNSREP